MTTMTHAEADTHVANCAACLHWCGWCGEAGCDEHTDAEMAEIGAAESMPDCYPTDAEECTCG